MQTTLADAIVVHGLLRDHVSARRRQLKNIALHGCYRQLEQTGKDREGQQPKRNSQSTGPRD